jgi:hypothetical protein
MGSNYLIAPWDLLVFETLSLLLPSTPVIEAEKTTIRYLVREAYNRVYRRFRRKRIGLE